LRSAEVANFRVAHATWLFGLVAFFLPAATWSPVSRFDLTRAIVEQGSLRIDRDVRNTGDRAFSGGHWYTDKAPFVSFAAVPVYAAVHVLQHSRGAEPAFEAHGSDSHPARHVIPNKPFSQALYACSLVTNGLAGVAVGLLLFELLRRRTTSRVAFVSSTLVLLGTPLFSYSTSFYSHVPAAALLLGAALALDRRGLRPADALPSRASLRVAGACLALAVGCEYLVAVPAAVMALAFAFSLEPRERLTVAWQFALGAFLPALALAAYHTAAFGRPWLTGYSFVTNPEFAGQARGLLGLHFPTLAGVFGLTFGVRRGLFALSPVAVVGVLFGYAHVRRRHDRTFALGLWALLALFVVNAGYYMWWGGAADGPRHLVPALPFLAAGVMVGLGLRQRWARLLTLGAGLLSVLNYTLLTAVGVEGPERGDLLYGYAWPRIMQGRLSTFAGSSNLGMRLGLTGVASLAPFVAWGVLGYYYLWRKLSRRPWRAPAPN